MEESTNTDELEYYWTGWRKATGKKMREAFLEYADLLNQAAWYACK
jgi:hypothetical protein